jgi:DNA-directed RNA polymerase specialized sigma24 family protein
VREVTSEEVKVYLPLVESLARRFKGPFAERDDLIQEGLIDVWHALQKGVTPSQQHIMQRMRKWVNRQKRLKFG